MRILKGRWAGTDLVSPAARVRPTAEKLRDRWLDVLEPHLEGARVVDLFAGSGALGLEALSRGAASADFVENAPAALHALKANVAKLGLKGPSAPRVRVFKRDAILFVDALGEGAYDIAFADPPYLSGKLDRVLAAWRATRFAAVLGVEHAADHELPVGGRLIQVGDGTVTLFGLSDRGHQERRR